MNTNTNTNINDYSIEDLLNLLEIEIENLSKEEITEKIEFLNNNYFNENNNMQSFFYSVQNKLLNFLDNTINSNNNYNLKDILPNNNLIETMANIEDSQLDLQIQDEDNLEQENLEEQDNLEEQNPEEQNPEEQDNLEEQNPEQQYALQEENIQTSYNSFELVNLDKSIIENYEIYNYLHFNTLFRAKNNPLAETLIPSTNSNFILSEPINNISEIKLASLTIKKPFLISELKSNNKFTIKKYNRSLICDFSALIISFP